MHWKFLILIHCVNVVPLTKEKVENFPMMLSKACFNPESEFQRVPLYNFMPLDQILFLIYSCVIICSNTYLYRSSTYLLVDITSLKVDISYRFLKTQTENNVALKETDQKRNRKRNLVPASLGIIHIFLLGISYIGMQIKFKLHLYQSKHSAWISQMELGRGQMHPQYVCT